MRKYVNVDVAAVLGSVMETNTKHYKSDFEYDKKMFFEVASNLDGENNRLLWLSRPCGTECFKERDVYLSEACANISWRYYAESSDTILAYAVEITGTKDGKVIGNLYELDYRRHVEQIKRNMLPISTVTLQFEDGTTRQYSYAEFDGYKHRLQAEHGKITGGRMEPEDDETIKELMKQVHIERQKYTSAVFKMKTHINKS